MSHETQQSPAGIFATTHWSVIVGAQQERSAGTDVALERLCSEYEQSGRMEVFDALKIYLSGDRGQTPYQEAAAGLSMSVDAVKKNVERMRHHFGKLLREEIAETVQHASEVEDDMKFLRSALQN